MNKFKICSKAFCQALRSGYALSKKKQHLPLLFTVLLFSCGPSLEKMKEDQYRVQSQIIADSLNAFIPGLSTDTLNGISHDFIKTVDIKFRVRNVINTSNRIEDLTALFGGYITGNQLSSEVYSVSSIQTKKDSVLECSYYTRISSIRLRVPNKKMDSLLRVISDLAEFIDYRKLNCDDVKLKLLANHKTEQRLTSFQSRVKHHLDTRPAKLNEATTAEALILNKQESSDEKEIESYDLADQINYSTITIELYQAPQINSYLKANLIPASVYEPPFTEQVKTAFIHGLVILKTCLIFVINYWGLFLFLFLLFILFKKIQAFTKPER